jgi:hypothetical protein
VEWAATWRVWIAHAPEHAGEVRHIDLARIDRKIVGKRRNVHPAAAANPAAAQAQNESAGLDEKSKNQPPKRRHPAVQPAECGTTARVVYFTR